MRKLSLALCFYIICRQNTNQLVGIKPAACQYAAARAYLTYFVMSPTVLSFGNKRGIRACLAINFFPGCATSFFLFITSNG